MARFVAEVAEQGAIGFVHGHTALLAIGVIRFGQRDGDEAVVMSRHDLGAGRLRHLREEIEGQPLSGVLDAGRHRQSEPQQRIEQPMLGDLDLLPGLQVGRYGDVRNRPVVPAGDTKALGR